MPRTSRPLHVHHIVLRNAEVVAVQDLTPNMRRITLTGEDLRAGSMGAGFDRPPFVSDGFDDHVKLIFPPASGELPPAGTQEATRFRWNRDVMEFTRDYTVRTWDPDANEFTIDVVRHERGLAAEWAFRARPGDRIDFAGPKSCAPVSPGVDWHLLVGDETALPAIGRWLEEAPEGAKATVIVEVPTAQDRQEIETSADATIQWLARDGTPPGQSTLLLEAVRALDLPEGSGYVWCAGESQTLTPIRRHLRDLGLPKENVEVVGYWRRPAVSVTGDTPAKVGAVPAGPGAPAAGAAQDITPEVLHEVHEMTELLPPVLTRVAVTLGIGSHIAAGHTDLPALAEATGVAADLLRPVIEGMASIGLIETVDGRWTNTAYGTVLTEPIAVEDLSLDNPVNRQVLALVDLLDVLRSGRPSPGRPDGSDSAEAVRERDADELYYVLEPLGRVPVVAAAERLAVAGPAAEIGAPQIVSASGRGGRPVQVLTDAVPSTWKEHDCAVLLGALESRTEEQAQAILNRALATGPAVVVVERNADNVAADDHAAERVLTTLARTGVPSRTSADLEGLLRRAGATDISGHQLGWGFGAFNRVIVATR